MEGGVEVNGDPLATVRARLALAAERESRERTLHVPPGHPYSPLPSADDLARALGRADDPPRTLPGIELRETAQLDLLERLLPLLPGLPFDVAGDGRRFRCDNTWFSGADATFAALMLCHLRPRQVVEVGCGYSTALALDVDEACLGGQTSFTFIEPDAGRLRELVPAEELKGRLLEVPAQDVPLATFEDLGAGDVLLVDSSHVVKAGSDVQFLIDEVYPRLASGVHVHVHDIFHPFEYPAAWLTSACAVNEAYVLRALLQGSSAWEVELFDSFLLRFHREWFAEHLPRALELSFPAGGLWLRRR